MQIRHPKLRGEWAEMRFMAAAAEHGLHVIRPWGDSLQYDFVIQHEAHFVRVQVKSTINKRGHGYSCLVRGGKVYGGDPFDFLAAYIVPEDVWFIIPERVVHARMTINLYLNARKSRYEEYREAWGSLTEFSQKSRAVAQGLPESGGLMGLAVVVRTLRCAMCTDWDKCYAGLCRAKKASARRV